MEEELKVVPQYRGQGAESPTSFLPSPGLGGRENRGTASSDGLGDGG